MTDTDFKLVNITLDEESVVRRSADVEHERKVAIFDLLDENFFKPMNSDGGPYWLHLGIVENRLFFDIRDQADQELGKIILALSPFRRIIKDYNDVCESYFAAIKTATPSQIEAIDMGRRGLHNDGSELLRERLKDKIEMDHNTARRLFTLVYVLHMKG